MTNFGYVSFSRGSLKKKRKKRNKHFASPDHVRNVQIFRTLMTTKQEKKEQQRRRRRRQQQQHSTTTTTTTTTTAITWMTTTRVAFSLPSLIQLVKNGDVNDYNNFHDDVKATSLKSTFSDPSTWVKPDGGHDNMKESPRGHGDHRPSASSDHVISRSVHLWGQMNKNIRWRRRRWCWQWSWISRPGARRLHGEEKKRVMIRNTSLSLETQGIGNC